MRLRVVGQAFRRDGVACVLLLFIIIRCIFL